MPKTHDTRKQRAEDLLSKLERGPSLSLVALCAQIEHFSCDNDQDAALAARYEQLVKTWLDMWVIPAVRDLVPELRK